MRIQDTNKIMKEAQIQRHDGQYSPRASSPVTGGSFFTRLRGAMPDMDGMKRLMSDPRFRVAAGVFGALVVSAVSASSRNRKRTGWRAMLPGR